jgi:PAS domain S-box-containing protein
LHSVHFYDDDEAGLSAGAAGFAAGGLERGAAVFVICAPARAEALREELAAAGLDIAALAAGGRYVEFDAAATLACLVDGSGPHDAAFDEVIAEPVRAAARRFGRVRAIDTMVDLLGDHGRAAAARLQRRWNDLCERAPLDLLCAFRLDARARDEDDDPPAAVQALEDDDQTLPEPLRERLTARLQPLARALQHETALRRALQRRVERRELELADLLENSAAPMRKLALDGTILWANRAELELLGYARDEYVGRNIAWFHEDPALARDALQRLSDGGSVRDLPARLRHKDGSLRHVLISSSAFRLDGRVVYARSFTRDVTALVRTEVRLREELGAWEVLRRACVALSGELDVERLMQTVTDAAVELTHAQYGVLLCRDAGGPASSLRLRTSAGFPFEGLADFPLSLDMGILSAVLVGERSVLHDALPRAAVDGDQAADGQAVFSCLAAPLLARSGQVQGGLFLAHPERAAFTHRDELVVAGIAAQAGIAVDNARLFEANERARAEQSAFNETLERRIVERTDAMQRSEQQLDQLLSGIADYAIFLLDAEGHVLTWNTGAERIEGYTAEQIIGQSFALFYTPEDRAAGLPQRALATARADGKYEAEAWRMRKDGSRFWASVLLDAIHDRNGEVVGFAKVTRDMTERRAMEEQLQQSQRMEAVGRMTGGVAHDFNNLLTIIIGNLDSIARETELKPRVRTAAEHALRGAQRATALTQQLLAFSRRQPLNPKPTDVNRLVAGTAELLKRTFGEAIAIVTELSGEPTICAIDAAALENALINLAMNARDAMPTGGRLTISTATACGDPSDASSLPHDTVAIAVSDTGVGMSADVRDHAFEPFFTTKPAGRGTGLGLSQVYGFARQSGGLVKIHSEPGRGTTVTIQLPCPRVEEPATASESRPAELPEWSGAVLLVEDNEDVRRYAAGLLEELGFEVLEAADGETALALFERALDLRLLFTDIGLPGIDGIELARRVRLARPSLDILFTTGYVQQTLDPAISSDESSALLRKPYTRAQLAQGIRELLDTEVARAEPMRALLVEDDALLRDLTVRMLERMQFEVEAADSVAAATALLERGRRYAFALVDRLLGDGDGIAVARALHRTHPPTPVLLVSGYGEPEVDGDDAVDALADTLRKPYGYDALADAIARLGVRIKRLTPGRP